jgi:hypothetical protein
LSRVRNKADPGGLIWLKLLCRQVMSQRVFDFCQTSGWWFKFQLRLGISRA